MYPHRIRLRGPWEVEPLARAAEDARPVPAARRVTMPASWSEASLGDFVGQVRLHRRFGYPGRIDAHERVWLILPGVDCCAAVAVNGSSLHSEGDAGEGSREYDITDLLRPRNELVIDLAIDPGRAEAWGEAALEVRALAFLHNIEVVRVDERFVVRGVVAGQVDSLLELYLIADRHTAAYATVPPGSSDFAFELSTPDQDEEGVDVQKIRVDLVSVAVIWYTFVSDIASQKEHHPE